MSGMPDSQHQDRTSNSVSIVITNWNTCLLLLRCLDSIYKTADGLELQVIVVDNASSDKSVAEVRSLFPLVEIVEAKENLGFSRAVNLGLGNIRGNKVLIAHPDIEFTPGAISSMVRFLDANSAAGIVGADLRYPDGTPNSTSVVGYSGLRIGVEFLYFSLRPILRLSPSILNRVKDAHRSFYWDHSTIAQSDVIWNACMMFKREVLEGIGPFCEEFFVWYADVDWCARARKAGWKAFYHNEVKVNHFERQSAGLLLGDAVRYKVDGALVAKRMADDKQALLRRHHGIGLRILDAILEATAIGLETLRRRIRPRDRWYDTVPAEPPGNRD